MAKGKVTIKSLRAGQTVYRVCGFGHNVIMEKLLITTRPYAYKKKCSVLNGTMWVKSRYYYNKPNPLGLPDFSDHYFSLSDAGIYKPHHNSYNRTFYSYKAAFRWLEYVKTQPGYNYDDFVMER